MWSSSKPDPEPQRPEEAGTIPPLTSTDLTLDDEEYPEGGAEAWLVVLGAWCAMFTSMGLLNTLGILQAWVQEHQLSHMSESTIGWIFSMYAFLLYFCGAQVGMFILSQVRDVCSRMLKEMLL